MKFVRRFLEEESVRILIFLLSDELCVNKDDNSWKPLVLLIPLRLGLSEINTIYVDALKKCFEMPGTLGMIGGRPNQALYFIGYVGDEVVYLDPHTVQDSGAVNQKQTHEESFFDSTYHKKYASRISFSAMDPSLAVGFLCRRETDFKLLLEKIELEITKADGVTPIFEVTKKRPEPWFAGVAAASSAARRTESASSANVGEDFEKMENVQLTNSDDEFEIID
jgi:cysteine protease ATG4